MNRVRDPVNEQQARDHIVEQVDLLLEQGHQPKEKEHTHDHRGLRQVYAGGASESDIEKHANDAGAQEDEAPQVPQPLIGVFLLYGGNPGIVHRKTGAHDRFGHGSDALDNWALFLFSLYEGGQPGEQGQGRAVFGDEPSVKETVGQGLFFQGLNLCRRRRGVLGKRFDPDAFVRRLDKGSIQDVDDLFYAVDLLQGFRKFLDKGEAFVTEEVFPCHEHDDVSAGFFESLLEGLEELRFFVVREEDHLEREVRAQVEDPVNGGKGQDEERDEDQESMPKDGLG